MIKNRKQELVKNTLIIALGSISVQFVSFLLLPFYTAYLSTADYGTVDLIATYNFLLVPIIGLQLNMAAFRFLIDAREDEAAKKKIISNSLIAASVPTIASVILFVLILQFVHIHYAYWALATVITAIVPNTLLQFARGLGKNKLFAIGSIISGVTAIVLNVVLIAVLHMGASGMLASGVTASMVSGGYLFFALKLHKYISLRASDKALRKKLLHYSLPLIPNGVSWWIIDASDRTIISAILGVSSNGIYAVAYKFPTLFSTLFSFFYMSWTESASLHINKADKDEYFSEVSNISVRFFGSLAAMMIACISLFFGIFIGYHYRRAYNYIPILVSASFFNSIVGLYSTVYVAKKLTRQVANTSIASAALNISLSIATIKFIGMYGTAAATSIAYLVMAIYRHYDTKKYVSLTYEKHLFLKVGLLFALSSCLYYYNNPLLNITNVGITTIATIALNKPLIMSTKDKLLSKYKNLSWRQQTVPESL